MGNNKSVTTIIIVLLVLLLGVTGGIGFYLIKNSGGGEKKSASAQKNLSPDEIDTIKISEPITTNLAVGKNDGKNNHMIQFDISVAVDNTEKKKSEAMVETLKSKEDIVKHSAIDIVSRKTHEEILDAGAKDDFSKELLERLQDEFDTNLIVEIYISGWKIV